MIKILKQSTYNDLLFDLLFHKQQAERFLVENGIQKLKSAYEFDIKRVVLGKKGCGKTTLLKKALIPKLRHYFLIDHNNEYDTVPADKKYIVDRLVSVSINKNNIIHAVKAHKNDVVIVDCTDNYGVDWWFSLLENRDFIITCTSENKIKRFVDKVGLIYSFQTMDQTEDFRLEHQEKMINC